MFSSRKRIPRDRESCIPVTNYYLVRHFIHRATKTEGQVFCTSISLFVLFAFFVMFDNYHAWLSISRHQQTYKYDHVVSRCSTEPRCEFQFWQVVRCGAVRILFLINSTVRFVAVWSKAKHTVRCGSIKNVENGTAMYPHRRSKALEA